jgi:hypothetical protein
MIIAARRHCWLFLQLRLRPLEGGALELDIEVNGNCSHEDTMLIERLAQAADVRPIEVRRRLST